MSAKPIILWLSFAAGTANAQNSIIDPSLPAEAKGRTIALEADRRSAGFGDTVTDLTMDLINEEGRTRTRRLTWSTLEVTEPDAGDKSLTLFHEPRDIAGTAFLSHTHVGRPDDQWLYLPSLRRVKRIAAVNQSSAFVGSEFSYEDLLSTEVERFDYRWLRDEACGTMTCFVIERRPRYPDSGYSKQIVWLDQAEFRAARVEYYDQAEQLEKTLALEDYRVYLDRFWRAHLLTMDSKRTGKRTLLRFEPFRFRTGLTAETFEPSALTTLR